MKSFPRIPPKSPEGLKQDTFGTYQVGTIRWNEKNLLLRLEVDPGNAFIPRELQEERKRIERTQSPRGTLKLKKVETEKEKAE